MEQISLYEKICDLGITFVFCGLNQYGSFWTTEKICQSIEEKSESFKDFLLTLNTYGMYDMLVAICEIVDLFCSTDIQNWFREQLRQCPDCDMILRMSNAFYQKRLADLQFFNRLQKKLDESFGECQNESKIILKVNLPQFENYIWESYDFDFLRKITRNNSRNVGVWFPMIYEKSNIDKYANKLDEYAFPYLIMCAKDIREVGSEDRVEEAIVRMRIADYLVELGLLYYPNIECAVNPLIELDPKRVAESDYNEYAQMIQNILKKKLGFSLYITDTLTGSLSEMISLSEYFGDSSYRKNIFLCFIVAYLLQRMKRKDSGL